MALQELSVIVRSSGPGKHGEILVVDQEGNTVGTIARSVMDVKWDLGIQSPPASLQITLITDSHSIETLRFQGAKTVRPVEERVLKPLLGIPGDDELAQQLHQAVIRARGRGEEDLASALEHAERWIKGRSVVKLPEASA